MSWQIDIARDARKELAGLHPQIQLRISKAILALEKNPFPSGCKKLKNRDGFRIRVGDLSRALFRGREAEENYHRQHRPSPRSLSRVEKPPRRDSLPAVEAEVRGALRR